MKSGMGLASSGHPEVSRLGQMCVWWEVRMSQSFSLVSFYLCVDWGAGGFGIGLGWPEPHSAVAGDQCVVWLSCW